MLLLRLLFSFNANRTYCYNLKKASIILLELYNICWETIYAYFNFNQRVGKDTLMWLIMQPNDHYFIVIFNNI